MSFFERYRRGEREQVWAELVSAGEAVRNEPLLSDARDVARETMRRARHNVEVIVDRLREIGYRFDFEGPAIQRIPPAASTALERLDADMGPLPLSLHTWFDVVGNVRLTGSHPWLSTSYEVDRRRDYRLTSYSDPLVIRLEYRHNEILFLPYREAFGYETAADQDAAFDPELADACILELAPDDCHKAGVSGGGPYFMAFPNRAADARLYGDQPYGFFVEYLRECFVWGGFPGIKHSTVRPDEQLALLTRDLEPI